MNIDNHRIALLALVIATAVLPSAQAQTDASLGAVVVTGAPSGIGRKITERLASNGYWVYAGARTQQEMDALNAIRNVEAVRSIGGNMLARADTSVLRQLMDELVQLNANQPYAVDRHALVRMLDDARWPADPLVSEDTAPRSSPALAAPSPSTAAS